MLVDLPLVRTCATSDGDVLEEADAHLGKTFVMDEKLTSACCSAELHKYADAVGETVEQARMG